MVKKAMPEDDYVSFGDVLFPVNRIDRTYYVGICSHCGCLIEKTNDGKITIHTGPEINGVRARTCPGSLMPPQEPEKQE